LRELKPDVIIDKEDHTMIIDAKYKKHLFYLRTGRLTPELSEEHRKDIHQILAYVGISLSRSKQAVLLYPQVLEEGIIEKLR